MVFTCLAHGLTHLYLTMFTPLAAVMGRELGTDYEGMTFYFSVCTLFFGLGAVPAGWLSDRFGEKALLVAFFVGCAIGGAVISAASDTRILATGFVLLGLATSIFHPVGNALITRVIRARGRALGINGIAGSAGTALGPVFGGIMTDVTSWHWAFLALSAPGLALGIWLTRTDLGPEARVRKTAPPTPSPARIRSNGGRFTIFAVLLTAMTCGGMFYHLFTMALPSHLSASGIVAVEARHGGLLAGLALLLGGVGQLVGGFLSDRYDERRLYVLSLLVVTPLFFLVGHTEGTWAVVAACAAATFMFTLQPVENSMIARFSPAAWRGRIFSLKFVLAFSVGGGGNWTAGVIAKHYGLPRVFETAAAFAGISLLCAITARFLPVRQFDESAVDTRRS